MFSRALALLIGLALADHVLAARIARKRESGSARALMHERNVGVLASQTVQDWTIGLKAGTTSSQIWDFCTGKCAMMGHPSEGGVAFAEFHGDEGELEALLRGHLDQVEYIEPEVLEEALPKDVRSKDLRGPSSATASWGLERVGVPQQRGANGRGVHVYVVDSGIFASHTDFEGRAVPTIDTSEGLVKECAKDDFSCAADGNGHGTHCAGTVGGKTYGVANGVTLHGVKSVIDEGRGYQSWVVLALDWMAQHAQRPAVASISLQYNGESYSMKTAVAAATQAGIAVVVAAGNVNNWSCDFSPANVPEAITVGATDRDDSKAGFSNFGACNNIWAPGVDITSAFNDGGEETWSGTSMATPHVSGAAALLLESEPTLTRNQILARLQETGQKGVVSGLKTGDPDLLLWVGNSPAPAPAPTPAPPTTEEPPSCPWYCATRLCIVDACKDTCSFCQE